MGHRVFRNEFAQLERRWSSANETFEGWQKLYQDIPEAKQQRIRKAVGSFESTFCDVMTRYDALYHSNCLLKRNIGGLEEKEWKLEKKNRKLKKTGGQLQEAKKRLEEERRTPEEERKTLEEGKGKLEEEACTAMMIDPNTGPFVSVGAPESDISEMSLEEHRLRDWLYTCFCESQAPFWG